LLWAISLIAVHATAQVGIGTGQPDTAAILDISSGDKGVLIPRITLKSATIDLDGISGQPTGLLIYNTGGTLAEGFYFWDGANWEIIESSTSLAPEISKLECAHAFIDPPVFIAGVTYSGVLKVPYTGGNEGKYPGGACMASEGNTGLKACLIAGRLEREMGYFVYNVTGKPKENSPTGATFPVTFGNKTCRVTVGTTEIATVTPVSSVGTFLPAEDNGVKGYHRFLTTYDGKFSVRAFVTESFTNVSFQIRSNVNDNVTIMWNGDILKVKSDIIGRAGNRLNLPKAKMWYGNNDETPVAVSVDKNASWGLHESLASEQRSYIWTTTDINEKIIYQLTFMMAKMETSDASANPANASKTKVLMRIEQIRAD
jgi:hypothetical protein